MKKLRRADDRHSDDRLLAFVDARNDIEAFEARQVKADRLREQRRKRDLGIVPGHHYKKGIGRCAVEGCDDVNIPSNSFRCIRHTYHYYFPYFVLGQRDYTQTPAFEEAA